MLKERNGKYLKKEIGNVKRKKYKIFKEGNRKCWKREIGNVKREKSSCKSVATGDTIATFGDTLSPVSVAATSWKFPKFATYIIILVFFFV